LWLQPPSLCFLAVVGFYVVVCGEVEVVLVFSLVGVAEASVQRERLSVASQRTSAWSGHLSAVEEVFLAHILRLLLGSFFTSGG
jgi:hypothetical protein